MDQKAFENYLIQSRQLPLESLQKLIATQKQIYGEKGYLLEFFSGEEAFYQTRYEKALKHYLKAVGVPSQPFFCFRASALLFQSLRNFAKAQEFAQKGLAIDPNDPHLQTISQPMPHESTPNIEVEYQADSLSKEYEMQTESDIFSSPGTRPVELAQTLTERLYPEAQKDPWQLVEKTDSEQSLLEPFLGEDPLEQAIKSAQKAQAEQMGIYLERHQNKKQNGEEELFCFNGWSGVPSSLWLTSHNWQGAGGFFLRWKGEGIALNPGRSFLERFHAQGLHVRDIHRVIVTHSSPEVNGGVEQIYRLNGKLNNLSSDVHLLHYYLQREAFQNLSPILKPQFKQERNNLHCLELFMDSPDVEKLEISSNISLHYFSTQGSNIGIRLDLKGEKDLFKMGYIAGGGWNPLLSHHLGSCDILMTAFGKTQLNDCHQITYNSESLGYYGCFSLQQEIVPKLMLCGEFDGSEGDIRLPAIQKLRTAAARLKTVLLPAENGFRFSISKWAIQCNLSNQWIAPQKIKVMQTESAFAPLKYIAPNCCF